MGPEHALFRLCGVPGSSPTGGRGLPAVLVHIADTLIPCRQRPALAEEEGVLHLPRRVVLRLEERVEVPERTLHDPACDLGKSHVEEDAAHLVEEALVGVGLSRVGAFREFPDIVAPEGKVFPRA